MLSWKRYFKTIENIHKDKKVDNINLALVMENATGNVFYTDLQLQAGQFVTAWVHKTNEIIEWWEDNQHRYYNAVVRGEKQLYVPNDGDTEGFANWTVHADTDMDTPADVQNEYYGSSSLEFGQMYRTRNIRITRPLKAGDTLQFNANPRDVTLNGNHFEDYIGLYLGAPAGGEIKYMVSIPGEQRAWDEWQNTRPVAKPTTNKRARVVIEIIPRWLAKGGKKL